MTEIKIHNNIIFRSGDMGKIAVYRNNELIGLVRPTDPRPLYITIKGNKPTSLEEAEQRVGKDVLKIRYEEKLKYAMQLGLVKPITEEDIQYACELISYSIFDTELNGMDIFSYRLKVQLDRDEWNEVKNLFYYDYDCEAWLTDHPVKVVRKLFGKSERFTNIIKAVSIMGELEIQVISVLSYIKYYKLLQKVIDVYNFGDGLGDETEFINKYGFTGKTKTISQESSISGYNLGTLEIEEKDNKMLIIFTYACPPDSWGGVAIVTEKINGQIPYGFIYIAMGLNSIKRYIKEFDIRYGGEKMEENWDVIMNNIVEKLLREVSYWCSEISGDPMDECLCAHSQMDLFELAQLFQKQDGITDKEIELLKICPKDIYDKYDEILSRKIEELINID